MAGDQNNNQPAPLPTSPSTLDFGRPLQADLVFDQDQFRMLEKVFDGAMKPEPADEPFGNSCSGGFGLPDPPSGYGPLPGQQEYEDVKPELPWPVPEKTKQKRGAGRKAKFPETDKKERRKAQNRQAAKTYREKQKQRKDRVEREYTEQINERSKIQATLDEARMELERLTKILEMHQRDGSCRLMSQPMTSQSMTSQSMTSQGFNGGCHSTPPHLSGGCTLSKSPSPPLQQGFEALTISPPLSTQTDLTPTSSEQILTPLSNQSFTYDNNMYSPTPMDGGDVSEKLGNVRCVLSPPQSVIPPEVNFTLTTGQAYMDSEDYSGWPLLSDIDSILPSSF